MSKRPLTYPYTPDRPAKRRQVSSVTFSGSGSMDVDDDESIYEPMDVGEEVTSTLKKRKVGKPPDGRGSNKVFALTGWAEQMDNLGILEPNRDGFVYPPPPPPPTTPVPTPLKREVVPGVPEPSTAGEYKMSLNNNIMAATTYKYLHVNSENRLTHETSAKVNVNFGGLPIDNIRRVGVLKATITNTNFNIYEGSDEVKIAVRLASGATYVTLKNDHAYYTLTELLTALNTKLQAYTNATTAVQTAVRDLEFDETTDEQVRVKVKANPATTADTLVSYALIADHRSHLANTLWYELGFDKMMQTLDQSRYDDYLAGDLHNAGHYTGIILPSQNFRGRLFYQANSGDSTPRPTQLFAFHRYVVENAKGFYLCSRALTSGGNVLKA